jgi:hypothetical protein
MLLWRNVYLRVIFCGRFMPDEHLTVDGTPIQASASQKMFRNKGGFNCSAGTDFHSQMVEQGA